MPFERHMICISRTPCSQRIIQNRYKVETRRRRAVSTLFFQKRGVPGIDKLTPPKSPTTNNYQPSVSSDPSTELKRVLPSASLPETLIKGHIIQNYEKLTKSLFVLYYS